MNVSTLGIGSKDLINFLGEMIVVDKKYIPDLEVIEILNSGKTLRCDTINGYVSLMLQREEK
ncbi:hypothetical protein [Brevibacillus laterosporus]|uniref:Uncharacterized protein n=1 Tax=Brevibacillus laterosporus TaxID=1465 RepID=A0AAP3DLY3_BRELA|nr:hypothetical protein [Brevibacillus laterosporus]MCR8982400.1 hypothetical protein [Brevibacillus laterosporus]MCZ0809555.1 hypothetical protein [Brevibacillus laterosporus]MCZ0828087.1 hypothetical protein [Brevibacillus laterosporus]MCZ0852114.1 hypothetical protein [Brevibacillus laterosporus]